MGFLFPGCVLCVCYHWHGVIPWENPVLPGQLECSSRPRMWESSSQGFPVCPWEVLQEQLQRLRLILHRSHGAHRGQPVARYPLWCPLPAGSLGTGLDSPCGRLGCSPLHTLPLALHMDRQQRWSLRGFCWVPGSSLSSSFPLFP